MKRERVLLDEARLTTFKPNLKAKPFLLEVEGGLSQIEKWKRNPDIPIYLTGIVQTGDKPNRNGRIYPWSYLKRECIRYMDNEIKENRAYGELDHPENSTTPSLNNASHTIEDMTFKGKDVIAKVKVLNAFMPSTAPGLKIRGFILNNNAVGISSRALGSLQENTQEGYDVVDEDLEMICWDVVGNASNYGSERLDPMLESKKVALLTESQLFGGTKRPIAGIGLETLTEEEKVYLSILGVERFLQLYTK